MSFHFSPKIVTDGLVLYLDAANTRSYNSTTDWFDLSIKGNNGYLTNGPTFSSFNGGVIIFDGINDYIQVNSPFGDIDWSSRPWSVNSFMKLNSLGDRCLVNLNSSNTSDYVTTNVFSTDGSSYWYFIKNSTSSQINFKSSSSFITGEIFNFTITYNGLGLSTNNINFYKNGVKLVTSSGGSAGVSNQSGLQIGGVLYPLNGDVYNFLMYNKELSSTEVLQNYNTTKSRFGL